MTSGHLWPSIYTPFFTRVHCHPRLINHCLSVHSQSGFFVVIPKARRMLAFNASLNFVGVMELTSCSVSQLKVACQMASSFNNDWEFLLPPLISGGSCLKT